MLTDPLNVKSLSLPAHTAITVLSTDSFAVTDIAPGKSVRVGALASATGTPEANLTISHSVSNENKPSKTDRTLVRIDLKYKDLNGRELLAYAYMVVGIPRGAVDPSFQPISVATLGSTLVSALLGVVAVSATAATLDETKILRILAGEP